MAAKRAAMRRPSSARGSHTPTSPTSNAGGPYSASPAPNDENRCPVVSSTSSARTIRREFPGSMRAAATGSAAVEPRRTHRAKPAAVAVSTLERGPRLRIRGAARCNPSTTARTYRPVPPTSSARRPRASMSAIAARAATCVSRDRPLLVGIGDVDRWCGTASPLSDRRFGRADVHAPVHLHGVERDDLDVVVRGGNREGNRRLPRRGRSDDRQVAGHTTATGMRTRRRGAGFDQADEVRRARSAVRHS